MEDVRNVRVDKMGGCYVSRSTVPAGNAAYADNHHSANSARAFTEWCC